MKTSILLLGLACALTYSLPSARAGSVISSAVEPDGGEPEGIAITGDVIELHANANVPSPYTVPVFGEDVFCFTDRDHQYNGADATGLPAFLVGGDYIMTANDARDNIPYSIEFTTAVVSRVYVLFDIGGRENQNGAGMDLR